MMIGVTWMCTVLLPKVLNLTELGIKAVSEAKLCSYLRLWPFFLGKDSDLPKDKLATRQQWKNRNLEG
ncbi:hypothetical protein Y1Q_0004354 [Alligator mississippiensis]|uniref:Uncharacterized protein n=1 Tax=Alligator mississippiensis TaxID=8496 RepID=A0A151MIM7_ALLMI|nr:hypothetical protein Y1Q_0004354 [Alligator mississippiensis]